MTVSSNNYQKKFGFKNDQIKLKRNSTDLMTTSLHIPSSAINKSSSKKIATVYFKICVLQNLSDK